MLKIIFTILFSFFIVLNYVSAQDTNDIKAECDTQKFENILNCDYKTVIEKCHGQQTDYDLRTRLDTHHNYTKYSHNNFIGASLGYCGGSFSDIFGMDIRLAVMYKWDAKTTKNYTQWNDKIFESKKRRVSEILKNLIWS